MTYPKEQLTKKQVLRALRSTSEVPYGVRMIYEVANPRGSFAIDYASYPGGTIGEVPRHVIDELLAEGVIERAFPDASEDVKGWRLKVGSPSRKVRHA